MTNQGRLDVLNAKFGTVEKKPRAKSPARPEDMLRQCILTNVKVGNEELDYVFLLIGEAKPDDLYSIEKFACTSDLIKPHWGHIRLLYETWLAGKWDKKLFPLFPKKVTIDQRLAAMNQLLVLNANRRSDFLRR
jgi:hypothetical protein